MQVVTHPGKAHADDFLACAVALAAQDTWGTTTIYRREPTQDDLDDPKTWVIDVGRKHDPEKNNYDHHQMQGVPKCALTLVLEGLVLDMDLCREALPWLASVEHLDALGPVAAAKRLADVHGIECQPNMLADALMQSQSPVQGALLELFGKWMQVPPESFLHDVLLVVGKHILRTIDDYQFAMSKLNRCPVLEIEGLKVLDIRHQFAPDEPSFYEQWVRKNAPSIAIVAMRSNRDAGNVVLVRREPFADKIDFHKCRDMKYVTFAHANGFMISLSPMANIRQVVQVAAGKTTRDGVAAG